MAGAEVDSLDYDLIVIGAGAGGLRAAIEASSAGAKTAVLSKSLLGKALTSMAQDGAAVVPHGNDRGDSWQSHFCDTVRSGGYLGDWRKAQLLAQEAPDRFQELERWGTLLDRTREGRMARRHLGGHRSARLAHRADRIGLEVLRALQYEAVRCGVGVHMECNIQRLLLRNGRICGALGYRRHSGEFVVFRSKAIILATGGGGRAWQYTTHAWESTGDGVALALEAGAELMDMEFVQFHPTGMAWPPPARGAMVPEFVLSLGGVLRNASGRRFLFDYVSGPMARDMAGSESESDGWRRDPRNHRLPPELLPASEVCRAIDAEIRAGRGTPHRGVWLDIAGRCPAKTLRREMPSTLRYIAARGGVDLTREPIEVAPSSHVMSGGVRVDAESCASSVPGLFAVGEVAAGLHGAGCLSGNALSECLVFGRRAGAHAAQFCAEQGPALPADRREVDRARLELAAPLHSRDGDSPHAMQEELRRSMHEFVGVSRTGSGLSRVVDEIRELQAKWKRLSAPGGSRFNPAWDLALDLRSLLAYAEATARAALERRESRGSHLRSDCPVPDAQFESVNIVIRKTDGELTASRAAVRKMPAELKRLINWSKQWLTEKPGSGSGGETRAAERSRTSASSWKTG